jgi:hypothetical protein
MICIGYEKKLTAFLAQVAARSRDLLQVVQVKRRGDGGKRLTTIQFEQGRGAFERFDHQCAFGKQCLKRYAVVVSES